MPATEFDRASRLDLQLDAVLCGAERAGEQIDPEETAVLHHIQMLAARPTLDAAFVRRLKRELLGGSARKLRTAALLPGTRAMHLQASPLQARFSQEQFQAPMTTNPTRVSARRKLVEAKAVIARNPNGFASGLPSRADHTLRPSSPPWWQRLEIAAVLLVLAVLAGYLVLADQGRRVAQPPQFAGLELPPAAMSRVPVRLRIDAIGVDAPIEPREPDVEPALIPAASDPFVVAWRYDTSAPGEGGNVVLEGHLDYMWTLDAVFADLADLTAGDRVDIIGANRTIFSYTVEWLRRYPLAAASEEQQREILGPTDTESVTLITAAGALDRATGLYSEVLVVRARFDSVSSLPTVAVPDPAECRVEPRTIDELDTAAAAVIAREDVVLEFTGVIVFLDTSASSEITAAVLAAARELVACLNANDTLRAYALYSDDGLARLLNFASAATDPLSSFPEWEPDFSPLTLPATPVPEGSRLALIDVGDVSLLEDGRVMATVTIGPGSSGVCGVPTGVPVTYFFERGDRYRIDEFFVREPDRANP